MGASCHNRPDQRPVLQQRYWKRTFLTLIEQNPDFKHPPFWLQPVIPLVKKWDRPTDVFTRPSRWTAINRLPPDSKQLHYEIHQCDVSMQINLFDLLSEDFRHFDHPVTMLVSHFTEQFLTHYQPQIQAVLGSKQPHDASQCLSKSVASIISFAKVLSCTVVNLYTAIEAVLIAQHLYLMGLLLACLVSGKC